ncbi:MAG: hypothetical protein ACI87E_004980 [Mariniblastus sp.]|jgi:hypothetical protein
MSQLPPPGQDDDEIEALTQLVAENLADGESPDEIAEQLIASGWSEDDAMGFVHSIQHQLGAAQNSHTPAESSQGRGWLLWIGVFVVFRILSYLFK